jgi:hypothetical protein
MPSSSQCTAYFDSQDGRQYVGLKRPQTLLTSTRCNHTRTELTPTNSSSHETGNVNEQRTLALTLTITPHKLRDKTSIVAPVALSLSMA